jgi:hypothetical protein
MDHSKSHDGGTTQEKSSGKASYAVVIHLILLVWVHVTFGTAEDKVKDREFRTRKFPEFGVKGSLLAFQNRCFRLELGGQGGDDRLEIRHATRRHQ